MNRLTYFLRRQYNESGRNGYILKCDIRKYFDSISHPVLLGMVKDMKLTDQTKWLLEMIIKSYCFELGRGIPMGNQTSQWFFLFYLDELDRLVKEKLQKLRGLKSAYRKGKTDSVAIRRSVVSYRGAFESRTYISFAKKYLEQFHFDKRRRNKKKIIHLPEFDTGSWSVLHGFTV